MKIKKISKIVGYKSFHDFKWSDFCKAADGSEQSFNPFNLLFGENGCGKSSISEILKDITKHTPFSDLCSKPTSVELKIDSNIHTYNGTSWNNYLPQNSILFFDQNFIDDNVHTNGERSNERNKHSQNAGKLLVELDAEAITKKGTEEIKKQALDDFETANYTKLNQSFLPQDLEIYAQIKGQNDEQRNQFRRTNVDNYKNTNDTIEELKVRRTQTVAVSTITTPSSISLNVSVPAISSLEEIFKRKIENETVLKASEQITLHIQKHKDFIEKGLQILDADQKDNCPFCLQSLQGQDDVIAAYNSFFNQEYKQQKERFIDDINALKAQLKSLVDEARNLPIVFNQTMDSIQKVWIDYEFSKVFFEKVPGSEEKSENENLTFFTERKNINDKLVQISLYPEELVTLELALEELKKLDNSTPSYMQLHKAIEEHFVNMTSALNEANRYIQSFAEKFELFKAKYSNIETIVQEIEVKQTQLSDLHFTYQFFEKDLFNKIAEYNDLATRKAALKEEHSSAKRDLETYINTHAPTLVLDKMMHFLGRFNLSFTLQPHRVTNATVDIPFAFKIMDANGQERNIKAGLSEGERQLISLAFFFAINENVADKANKVLLFDDPITSLDAANLKILSDVIFEQVPAYSQVFVFTHHPLFSKYLSKKENPNPNKFGILKNVPAFGGSFIFFDAARDYDLHNDLKNCHTGLMASAMAGTLNLEECALRYGHLLRLSVERFIKNELLMWNKDDNFSVITTNLKDTQSKIRRLSDSDLDNIEKVFKYCNYANFLHADKEASSALNELLAHIGNYLVIIDSIRTPVILPSVVLPPAIGGGTS